MNNNQTIFTATINQKFGKKDKNEDDYLILKLDNDETIFVFDSKVSREKWAGLQEDKEYKFTVEEGKDGSKLLSDFEVEI